MALLLLQAINMTILSGTLFFGIYNVFLNMI